VREAGDQVAVMVRQDLAEQFAATDGLEIATVARGDARIVLDRCLEAFTPWRARGIERLIERVAPDVVLFPQQSIFPKDVARLRPSVLVVVDVQYLIWPQHMSAFDRRFRPAIYPRSLRSARKVIAISEFTRGTLIEHCGLAPEKVVTVPLGVAMPDPASVTAYDGIGAPYLYYPAATFVHKDHETLMRTFAALRRERAEGFRYKLVLSGQQTSQWAALQQLASELGIDQQVIHLGFVPFADVHRLYRGASAVVFPTKFEGFGLPILEATQLGARVITSRLEIFDELGVPKRWQIDFADPAQLLHALSQEGPSALEKPPMTWTDTARRTLEVCRAAI
jgi:glycosyltransferase involved in cell wall biosynthesis